jgi:hypothetical protein
VVYEGLDLTTGATVALKVMSVKDGRATVPIKGVRREIEYAASVQHDNVVKLVDFVADEHQIVIVWELIEGSDLLDLLNERGGRLDEAAAAFYFAQLLRGVTFIHAHGLCHRDLKPENCMVERSTNRLKIIDFGLSKHQQSAVTLGVGTPDYMAPELLGNGGAAALHERRVGQYDARACDVWAMGVLLYLLVTGQYPFEDPHQPHNVVATLQNIAAGRARPLPRRLGADCVGIIGAMLTKDPAQRITLQGLSEHPWMRAAAEGGAAAPMEVDAGAGAGPSSPVRAPPPLSPSAAAAVAAARAAAGVPPADAPRVESFSFPSVGAVVNSKPTPITPKVVAMQAGGGGGAGSPTVLAPRPAAGPARAGGSGGRDCIVPMVPGHGAAAAAAAADKPASRVGGFCKMWLGGFGSAPKAGSQ